MTSTTIQIRTNAEVKAEADLIFNRLGITMSDGINIFLRQVNLHGGFPFEVKLSNAGQNSPDSPQKQEHIRSLCGKYRDSKFSSERYFEQKLKEKELDK